MSEFAIVQWLPSGEMALWHPTTLDKLGKNEAFLEETLANSPVLMGLESRRTGIRGPFKLLQQVCMQTPSGRGLRPDIVMFAASGHVIVVEVKLYVNPELRDRAVIAQIIDYASSFAALDEQHCCELFGEADDSTWTESVESMFPGETDAEDLAAALLGRIQRGELNLVIACDKVPPGLPEIVAGIATQHSLGFDLDLVELTPYVHEVSDSAQIVFVPTTRLVTQIVSRTAVTVMYQQGDTKPSTSVQTTSLEEIQENLKYASRRSSAEVRSRNSDEVEAEFRELGNPVTDRLYQFAKQNSFGGPVTSSSKTANASFGFYVQGRVAGVPKRLTVFSCATSWSYVCIYLNFASQMVSDQTMREFRQRLTSALGETFNAAGKAPSVPLEIVGEHVDEFLGIMSWFKSQAEASLPTE